MLCPLWTFLKMGTLKFSSTLKQGMYVISGQRVSPFGERLIISVSFEDYSYSAISPIGTRSLPVTFNIKEANSKVAKCNLRKSNPNNYGLNKSIILDVGLTVFPKWECDRIAILAWWLYHMISVQTDSVNMESVVRCGQHCTSCTTVTTFCNGCDAMTQRLLLAWIIISVSHFTTYS